MRKQYHILNGDALKMQFPKSIEGELIVARECLVDGNVEGDHLKDLFKTRAHFISDNYPGCTLEDYYKKTVPEFEKIIKISTESDIHLWFEDDLFCQVNLWFVIHLISKNCKNHKVFLIRPEAPFEYNFGALSPKELQYAYKKKKELIPSKFIHFSKLWSLYQKNDDHQLFKIANKLKDDFPFVLKAVVANNKRFPADGSDSKPLQTLKQIIAKKNVTDFELIFEEFSKREAIYGFGDLQVKRLLDEIR